MIYISSLYLYTSHTGENSYSRHNAQLKKCCFSCTFYIQKRNMCCAQFMLYNICLDNLSSLILKHSLLSSVGPYFMMSTPSTNYITHQQRSIKVISTSCCFGFYNPYNFNTVLMKMFPKEKKIISSSTTYIIS